MAKHIDPHPSTARIPPPLAKAEPPLVNKTAPHRAKPKVAQGKASPNCKPDTHLCQGWPPLPRLIKQPLNKSLNTVNGWAVHILLQCLLVLITFKKQTHFNHLHETDWDVGVGVLLLTGHPAKRLGKILM